MSSTLNRIELIGASGVGKTTLYEKLKTISDSSEVYMTFERACKLAALNSSISLSRLDLFCYQKLLKYGLIKRKHIGLSRVILNDQINDMAKDRFMYNGFNVSFKILCHFLQEKDNPFYPFYLDNPFHVRKTINKFLQIADNLIIINKLFTGNDMVIMDEGILHYHPGITDYGFKNFSPEQLKSDPVFTPFGIISCEQPVENIFEQAMKRRKEGIQNFVHRLLNEDELFEFIKTNVEFANKKVESLKNLGIPCLHVNTGEPAHRIAKKIAQFSAALQ